MARYIALVIFFFIVSCETTTSVSKYKSNKNEIFIDVVEKKIKQNESYSGANYKNAQSLLLKWLEEDIKTNGFEGSLEINLLSISTEEQILDDKIKLIVNTKLEFIINKSALEKKKIIILDGSEYGELVGQFSINDKLVEFDNTIKRLIDKLSLKLSSELN